MLTQSKKRIFKSKKEDYSLKTLKSLINSINNNKKIFNQIKVKLTIVDHNSDDKVIEKFKKLLRQQFFKSEIINLDINFYKKKIKKFNQKGEKVTIIQISNMCNINQSFHIGKNCEDLIYFVEDDYLHFETALEEMISTYERVSSQLKKDLFICPSDYPYLYTKSEMTQNFLGQNYHWRKVDETLCTFLTSKKIIDKYWQKYISMCEKEHAPFEKPMHDIYEKELCISPIPSLALHFTNINSIFGLSPNVDWKSLWDENEN